MHRQSGEGVAAYCDSPQSARSAGANSAIRRGEGTRDPRSVACVGPEKRTPYSGARQGSRCTGNAIEILFMHQWEEYDRDDRQFKIVIMLMHHLDSLLTYDTPFRYFSDVNLDYMNYVKLWLYWLCILLKELGFCHYVFLTVTRWSKDYSIKN